VTVESAKRLLLLGLLFIFQVFPFLTFVDEACAENQFTMLNHKVVDAEFSKQLNRIITVSTTPSNRLHIYNPENSTETFVNLPSAPTCVSVSPDGFYAAVGHSAAVSYINLKTASLLKTFTLSSSIADVVLAGNGYAYAFATTGSQNGLSINLASGAVTKQTGGFMTTAKAKRHPSGNSIYCTYNNATPIDIYKISISNGTLAFLYDSPYHGDFNMGGDLWLSEDGLRIFTKCGNVFHSSETRAEDMTYGGALPGIIYVTHMSHSGTAGKVAVIPATATGQTTTSDTEIWLFDYEYLSLDAKIALPKFKVNQVSYNAHGRFVFFNPAGDKCYVIGQSDPAPGLVLDYGITAYASNPGAYNYTIAANSGPGGVIVPSGNVEVSRSMSQVFAITPSQGYQVSNVVVDGVSVGKKSSYKFSTVTGNHTISASFEQCTNCDDQFRIIGHKVVDAEYNKSYDKIVTIASVPLKQLHIHDPATGSDTTVDLPLDPTCVSISPDGRHAAVGHNGWISYVDLNTPALVEVYSVSTDVFDIVLAGNGYVYAFPRVDQWEYIRCINLQTGKETLSTGGLLFAGTRAKLHPGGNYIYGADNNLSPSNIEKYDITNGTATCLYNSPYHGDYNMGGDLWFSEDGLKILTKGGTVFHSSETKAEDMTYAGALSGISNVTHMSHSGTAGKVAVIPGNSYGQTTNDVDLMLLNDEYLTPEAKRSLPKFTVDGVSYSAHGRFVFFNSTGEKYYVIEQADAASGLILDYAISVNSSDTSSDNPTIGASAGSGGAIVPSGNIEVIQNGSQVFAIIPDPGYSVSDVMVDGVSIGKKSAYQFSTVTGNHTISAAFEQCTGCDDKFRMLGHKVIDAEYNKSSDKIITVSSVPLKQLHIYDPATGHDTAVDLPLEPACVSVSPDGQHAAVGHNGWISYVDLATPALVEVYSISTDVFDVVLAGNGYVYALPRYDQWGSMRSINLQTGQETSISGYRFYTGIPAKLQPGGNYIYGAQNGKYSITNGTAAYLYAYSGDFPMCGDLWFSEDGLRIFTKCGNVFRSSETKAEDMAYNGAFSGISYITHLAHSNTAGKVAVIPSSSTSPSTSDGEVLLYDDEYLAQQARVVLPSFNVDGNPYGAHGRFVFFNSTGDKYYVIEQADSGTGLLLDYGIGVYSSDPSSYSHKIDATAGSGGSIAPSGNVEVIANGSQVFAITPSRGYAVSDVLVDGISVGKKVSYQFSAVTGNHTISASFEQCTSCDDQFMMIGHNVIDAEHNRTSDKIVTVSSVPLKQLHIYDPATGSDTTVDLPLEPSCVSVAPDGQHAAVGHNGWISYVDLNTPSLVQVYPVSTNVLDIVLAGNGYVYVFPRVDQWEYIRCISLGTGKETLSTGYQLYAGTRAKLHPGGNYIYTADNGLNPSGIQKYGITSGTAAYLYDSPYHGEYPMCGDLWFSEDGVRIFTKCGRAFNSSETKAEDMTYSGAMSLTSVASLDHSVDQDRIVAVPSSGSAAVWLYKYSTLALVGKTTLPSFWTGGNKYSSSGRFVFFNEAGDQFYVIAQADQTSGLPISYAVATFSTDTALWSSTITASSGANGSISPSGEVDVDFGSSQSFSITPDTNYHILDVVVDGASVGPVTSYNFSNIIEDHTVSTTFAIDQHTITASAGTHGNISLSGAVKVDHGSGKAFTITPDTNYHVSDVLVDGTSVGAVTSYCFSEVVTDHTISATFSIDQHTVSVSAGANGSISPSGTVKVDHGSSKTFIIAPDANYHISDVLVDGKSVGALTSYIFGNVLADHAISATFAIDQHTITASAGTHGSISPSGAVKVDHGSSKSFTITPDTACSILNVKVDGVTVGAVTSYQFDNVAANHRISADFGTSIVITSPKNGEAWTIGSKRNITWQYRIPISGAKVELLKAGAILKTLSPSVLTKNAAGSLEWRLNAGLAPGADYQIRVTSLDDSLVSVTSPYFIIATDTTDFLYLLLLN